MKALQDLSQNQVTDANCSKPRSPSSLSVCAVIVLLK
jgi:hypothetical protein